MHNSKSGHQGAFFFLGYQGQRQLQEIAVHNRPTFSEDELNGVFSHSALNTSGERIPDPAVRCFLSGHPTTDAVVPDLCEDAHHNPLPPHPFFQGNPALADLAIIDPARIDEVAMNYIAAGLDPNCGRRPVECAGGRSP